MKSKITSFKFNKFKSESSRDSNSQFEIFEFKDGVYSFSEDWKGYHPRGYLKMPSSDFFMTEVALSKVVDYIEKNGLQSNQSYPGNGGGKGALPVSPLPPSPGAGSRSYGLSLSMEYDGKPVEVSFVYKTGGPRDPKFEEMELSKKLNGLYDLLSTIHFVEKLKPK